MPTPDRTLAVALRRVRRRWFALEWTRVAAAVAFAGAIAVASAAAMERLARPAGGALVLLVAGAVAVPLAVLVVLAWPLRRRPDDRQVARYVEERCPELDDRLASATDLLHTRNRAPLAALVIAAASRDAAALDLDRVVPRAVLLRRGLAFAAAAAAMAMAAWVARETLDRGWTSAWFALFPPEVTLEVRPGDIRVVEGATVPVSARLAGLPDGWPAGAFTLRVESGGSVRRLTMSPDGTAAVASLRDLREPLTYRVEGERGTSRDYQVEIRRPPRVRQIDVSYQYPRFTGLAGRTEADGGDIFAPQGTRVTLRVLTEAPVRSGALAFGHGERQDLVQATATELTGELTVAREGSYRIALADDDGLTSNGETEYFIRVMDDRPPEVRIVRPGGDTRVTRLQEVIFEARADDDYGIGRFDLVIAPRGRAPRIIPLNRDGDATSVSGRYTLFLEELDVQPGDFVSYYARARDVGRGKPPTEARSDIFFLEVRPFTEEFQAAQSQAFQGGGGSFDDLAAQQKDVVIATWKLERRSGAGRSRADIQAIARAQAEVRSRAEKMLRGSMTRARPARPNDASPAPAPSPSAMRLAVDAMGRAEAELQALDTTGAIPHEMEALNQLLRAQAEVTRRQVARQQAGAGGRGSQTGNQDLSALFDRELQRQQQTNYQNRSSAAQGQENESANDPLDKLRELARRQDDLARRQQDLARRKERMSPEEARRQLERLTREQQELQRQVEQLGREMGQQGQSGGEQARGGQGAAGQNVRQAADEMRRAASELERGNTGSAGGSGARAADHLRNAERQVAGTMPDERRRAAGDLQLDLQRLAEAERRVAREAGQAALGGTGDDMRRLAGEQDRLAERVERLGRDARALAEGASDEEVNRAVRTLERERLAGRMRDSAGRMREAGRDGNTGRTASAGRIAQEAGAMADALERAAGGLAAASGRDGEGRRLSERLARARELRDQLSGLEREIERMSQQASQRLGGASSSSGSADRMPASSASGSRTAQGGEGGRAGAEADPPGGAGQGRGAELPRLQEEYARRLREARQLMNEAQGELSGQGLGMSTPTDWEPSVSAPGTEAFKQDFARWDALRRDVGLAMERLEAAISGRLSERELRDRLAADGDERAPEAYREQLKRYYEAITKKDKP